MGTTQIAYLARSIALGLVSATLVAGCLSSVTPRAQPSTTAESLPPTTGPAPTPPRAEPTLQATPDVARALTGIETIEPHPAGTLTFVERAIMINSPDADMYVLVFEDENAARYSVDPLGYVMVQFEPSPLRFAPGEALTEDALRRKAFELASKSKGFPNLKDLLQYEEGQKKDNHFFTWIDPTPGWKYNRPMLQIGLRNDGILINYINTLVYAP